LHDFCQCRKSMQKYSLKKHANNSNILCEYFCMIIAKLMQFFAQISVNAYRVCYLNRICKHANIINSKVCKNIRNFSANFLSNYYCKQIFINFQTFCTNFCQCRNTVYRSMRIFLAFIFLLQKYSQFFIHFKNSSP
jgi:hypothetical protein